MGLILPIVACSGPDAGYYEGVSDRLELGRCMTQDDCAHGTYCAATAPGINECLVGTPPAGAAVGVSRHAPNGRAAPPAFLIDGRVLRERVRGPTP